MLLGFLGLLSGRGEVSVGQDALRVPVPGGGWGWCRDDQRVRVRERHFIKHCVVGLESGLIYHELRGEESCTLCKLWFISSKSNAVILSINDAQTHTLTERQRMHSNWGCLYSPGRPQTPATPPTPRPTRYLISVSGTARRVGH